MKNGTIHRNQHGDTLWYLKGLLHRTDGPAVEYTGRYKSWYLNGEFYGNDDTPPIDYTLAVLILEGLSE